MSPSLSSRAVVVAFPFIYVVLGILFVFSLLDILQSVFFIAVLNTFDTAARMDTGLGC